MSKIKVLFVAFVIGLSSTSFARKQPVQQPAPGQIATDDAALVQAVQNQKNISFLTAKGLVVSQLLQDDNQGLPHQKFNVKLSNGRVIMIVSNLDMCEKVPVKIGDVVSVGGQFIPTGKASGLVHWTHKDPRHTRPDGFIELGGHVYCQ
ncbi:MAG: DUF3465 domain-containing protein [Bdellovibrio sp.]|nr:DUF3465 domain-containing protein [Bdellovibrio sp.]